MSDDTAYTTLIDKPKLEAPRTRVLVAARIPARLADWFFAYAAERRLTATEALTAILASSSGVELPVRRRRRRAVKTPQTIHAPNRLDTELYVHVKSLAQIALIGLRQDPKNQAKWAVGLCNRLSSLADRFSDQISQMQDIGGRHGR